MNLATLTVGHGSPTPFFNATLLLTRLDRRLCCKPYKTQQRIHQRASPGRLVNMQKNPEEASSRGKNTARLFSACERKKHHPHTSQPLRRNTAAPKHSSPTKDVLIGLLLHLSTLAAPPNDFVLPQSCWSAAATASSENGSSAPDFHAKTHRFAPTSRC